MNTLGRIWNRFPEYNMCGGVCVRVQCTLYMYPLKSIKNGSYLWRNLCLFYHFGRTYIEKANSHAQPKPITQKKIFVIFETNKNLHPKARLNKDKTMLCKTLHNDFFI